MQLTRKQITYTISLLIKIDQLLYIIYIHIQTICYWNAHLKTNLFDFYLNSFQTIGGEGVCNSEWCST